MSFNSAADNEWQAQLAESEDVYADIFPELTSPYSTPAGVHSGLLDTDKDDSEKRTSQIPEINTDLFRAHYDYDEEEAQEAQENEDSNEDREGDNKTKRQYSIASSNTLTKIQQLEAQFLILVDRLKDISDSVSAENAQKKSNLLHAKNQLAQICGDIDKFQFERIDSVSAGELNTGHDAVKTRRKSLNKRCDLLRTMALDTVTSIEGLLEGVSVGATVDAMPSFDAPRASTTAVDGLTPDWSLVMGLQNRRVYTSLCDKFTHYMQQSGLPVPNAAFIFLQEVSAAVASSKQAEGHSLHDSKAGACSLYFDSYEFAMGELDAILYFVSTQPSKVRSKIGELVFVNCGLSDEDCETIANHLDNLQNLHSICLQFNDISGAGAERLCMSLMMTESHIESLNFAHNCIDGSRIKRIAQIYRYCPLLTDFSLAYNPIGDAGLYYLLQGMMNPLRKAHSSLPVPPALSSMLTKVDFEQSNLDEVEDIGTDEDSEPKVSPEDPALSPDSAGGHKKSNSFKLARRISMQQKRVMTAKKSFKLCVAMRSRIESKWLELGIIGLGGGSLMEGADVNMSKARIARIFKRCVIKLKALGLFLSIPRRGTDVYALDVSGCELSPFAGQMLKVAISDNTYICELLVSDNSLGDNGTKALCDLMKDVSVSLRAVELRNNGLSENAVKLLTQAANTSHHLQSLDLSGNVLGPTAVNWVAAATGVYFLDDFSVTSISRQERARLHEVSAREQQALANQGADYAAAAAAGAVLSARRKSQIYNQQGI